MTIAPSDCPLDQLKFAPTPGTSLALHEHDPCSCLDSHQWRTIPGPLGAQVCTGCAATRCTTIRGAERCTRHAGHHGTRHHLFARG